MKPRHSNQFRPLLRHHRGTGRGWFLSAGLLVLVSCWLLVSPAQAEKTARSRPQLRVDSPWPTGTVHRLKLVSDGRKIWLYGAGVDKVVRRWEVTGQRGNRDLRPAGEFVWPVYRAERGVILALDSLGGNAAANPPIPDRIAIGGIGTKAPHVAFSRSNAPENVQVLSDPVLANSARQYVLSVALHPRGTILAVGEQGFPVHDRGRVLLWNVSGEQAKFIGRMNTGAEAAMCVKFSPDGLHLATVGARPPSTDNKQGSLVEIWDMRQLQQGNRDGNVAPPAPVSQTFIPAVGWADSVLDELCWIDSSTWAAATIAGVVQGTLQGNSQVASESRLIMRPKGVVHEIRDGTQFPFCEIVNETDVAVSLEVAGKPVNLSPGKSHREPNPQFNNKLVFRIEAGADTNPVWNGYRYRIAYESWGIQPIPGTRNVVVGVRDAVRDVSRLVIQGADGSILAAVPESDFQQDRLHAISILSGGPGQPALLAAAGSGETNGRPTVQIRLWELNGNRAALVGSFPPASEVTGGPVRAVAVASDGRHIVWDNRSHPAGGKFTRAFDPAFRSGGIEDAQDVDDPLDVPQVATSQVARISQGAVLLKPQGANGAPLRLAQTEYFAEVIEKEDDDGRKFYRFRHRLPDVPGSFIDVAEKDVKFVQATRSHALKPSGLRSANGLVVLTPDAPQMAGTNLLQRLDNGLFFEPQEFNGDWVRVTASGRSGWLEKTTVVGAEKWSIFDPNGQVIADLPVLKNNRPMIAARLQLDGRDLLAVGHQVGIRVWDLNALRRGIGRRALTRSFYGHPDQVRALSFSPDGRWLLSGSDDGTLSGWTLEGMTGGSELGATLNGQNRISSVPPRGSPAWEAGFERGQEVTSILIAGREVPRASLADALRHSIPGDELSVNVAGGKGSLITPVQHDPLWIFYPFHNDDWVLWSPYSFFDSGFADEDSRQTERLKWQTDLAGIFVQGQQGVDVRRIFVQQASVQTRVFRQPALLNNLIAYRTVPPELFDIPSAPVMSLRFAAGQGQVPGGAVFSAFPLSPDEQVVSRTVFLNGLQVGQTDTQKVQAGANSQVQVRLDSSRFRSGENRVVGVAEVQLKSGGTDDQGRPLPAQKFTFRTVESFRFARTAAPAPRVHYLGIGVNTLDPKFQLPALRFAASGVKDVAGALQQAVQQGTIRRSNPYSQGTHQLLADGGVAPTLAATEQAFSRLAADADPDDLAVIFLAGHGEGDSSGGFRFMLQDRPMQQQQLTSLLSSLPCRTLLLLDTCHAGSSAGSAEQIQLFSNIVNGPLVITACGADQESLEHDRIGGGFFTAALVEGLTGNSKVGLGELPVADTSGDGQISLEELCRFTQRRTSEMVEQAKEKLSLTGETQEPQFLQSSSFDDARQIFIR